MKNGNNIGRNTYVDLQYIYFYFTRSYESFFLSTYITRSHYGLKVGTDWWTEYSVDQVLYIFCVCKYKRSAKCYSKMCEVHKGT